LILVEDNAKTVQEVDNEEDDDDQFLKDLEKENKVLEEELKNLQQNSNKNSYKANAGFLPK